MEIKFSSARAFVDVSDEIMVSKQTLKHWHRKHKADEPKCGPHEWRSKDRYKVIKIADMSDDHLNNCIRFASKKGQHSSKLSALLNERIKRLRKAGNV